MRITGNAIEGISIEIKPGASVLVTKPRSWSPDEVRFPLDERTIDRVVGMLMQAKANLRHDFSTKPNGCDSLGAC